MQNSDVRNISGSTGGNSVPQPIGANHVHKANKVLEAIRAGDWKTARNVHERHRSRSSRLITEILDEYRLPAL
jgi:hypothetical protein